MRTILRPSAATGEDFAERLDTGAEASVSEAAAAGSGCQRNAAVRSPKRAVSRTRPERPENPQRQNLDCLSLSRIRRISPVASPIIAGKESGSRRDSEKKAGKGKEMGDTFSLKSFPRLR